MIERFFSNLTGPQRLLMFILVVALSAFLVAFVAGGWVTGVLVAILVLAILWLTRPLWKPSGAIDTRTRVALSSLTLISGVVLAILGKTPEGKPLLRLILSIFGVEPRTAESSFPPDRIISALILAFTVSGVFVVNWFARDATAMRKHPKPLDEDFPEQPYRRQLERFSVILMERLSNLDNETKWDDYFFAPLEAEVEVVSGRRYRKKLVDLMRALKAEQACRTVLVLGDPGAGKSIALRKLAKELLKEVEHTGRVPVYVNLKEWNPLRQWTEQKPPLATELREFILRRLKGDSVFADGFLDKYFDRMVDRGRFFFIFDSFDEIPAVLDVSESSWLIQHLSRLLTEFFFGQDAGRGIVASRFYRRPQFNRNDCVTFEIRPFSDLQIHEALLRSEKLSHPTIEKLFTSRSELIPIARNPFSAALIRIYAENHGGDLPSSQWEMYESYIQARFAASADEMAKRDITFEEVISGATDIAWCMFRAPEIGLEAPLPMLARLLPNVSVPAVTAVLRFSGLARLSSVSEASFSFVHRRLNEYFVTRELLKDPQSVTLQAIPTDSRYRDALVLYCEVGKVAHVADIARFCWNEIHDAPLEVGQATSDQSLRAVHCMRFLRDAFRTRSEVLTFVPDLARYILARVQPNGDLLAAKLALEATGLLPERDAERILIAAFRIRNYWISETALHSCRHLKRIGSKLEERLREYLSSISIIDFLRRHREIVFSLSLSDAFRDLRRYCIMRAFDYRAFVAALVLCCFFSPLVTVLGLALYVLTDVLAENTLITRLLRVAAQIIFRIYIPLIWLASVFGKHPRDVFTLGYRFLPSSIHGYVTLAYLALCLGFLPLLDLAYLATAPWPRFDWKFARDVLASLAGFWIVGAVAIVVLVPWFASHALIWAITWMTVASVCGLALIWLGIKLLIRLFKDIRFLRAVTSSTALTRSSIAGDFTQFSTSWFRRRYVEWLRDHQVQPKGTWPDKRPNCNDDRASSMLAQLDERWLGLDT